MHWNGFTPDALAAGVAHYDLSARRWNMLGGTCSNLSLPLGNPAFNVVLPLLHQEGKLRCFSGYPGEVCRVYRVEGL